MPLTKKGKKIMRAMKEQYGPDRGEAIFYASKNKGKIKGVEGRGAKKRRRPYPVGKTILHDTKR
jgi:hypothetical protein